MPPIAPELLAVLVCPAPECRGPLAASDTHLTCRTCGRRYRIEQSWPVLIPEEAEAPERPGGEAQARLG